MDKDILTLIIVCLLHRLSRKKALELSPEEKVRRGRRIPRVSIRDYTYSPFKYLFESRNNQALLNCCACDHAMFAELHAIFKPFYFRYTFDDEGVIRKVRLTKNGKRKGRRQDLDSIGCLGLVLYWYRTRGSCARSFPMAFGQTSTPLYKWLKFGRRVLLFALQRHPAAKVCIPAADEIRRYTEAITAKYPMLEGVWGAMDGLKLPIQSSTNYLIQNNYYNGWLHRHFLNSVFVFGADRRIRICTVNCPWHKTLNRTFNRCGGRSNRWWNNWWRNRWCNRLLLCFCFVVEGVSLQFKFIFNISNVCLVSN